MDRISLLRRIGAFIAIVALGVLGAAGGLSLMNVRADWALAAGALITVAALVVSLVWLWSLLKGNRAP